MSEALVSLEFDGPLAILTLDRPRRHNSLVPALLQQTLDALGTVAEHPDVRALVLQANGRSFSTGGDVRAFAEQAQIEPYARTLVGLLNRTILALIDLQVPVVAAVHGIVTGGSLGLVLAADIVLVAPETTFAPFYTTVGYSPDGGWAALLPHVIGPRRAAEALLIDRSISAVDALNWGLANRIVPADQAQAEARAVALCVARQRPASVRSAKRLLWRERATLADALNDELEAFVAQIGSDEARAGMDTFLARGVR